MSTYAALVDVADSEIQNVQSLAARWGDVRADAADLHVDLLDVYALLGESDFLFVFDAPDRDAAFRFAAVAERYGLSTHTMPAIPVERFGELVDEV